MATKIKIHQNFTTLSKESFQLLTAKSGTTPKEILTYAQKKGFREITLLNPKETLKAFKKQGHVGLTSFLNLGNNLFFVQNEKGIRAFMIRAEKYAKQRPSSRIPITKKMDKPCSIFVRIPYQGF